MSSSQPQFRITLWEVDTSTRWRGAQKAVVYDAKAIAVEEHANDTGSAYWTLSNDHPQIAKFQPLQSHYEICRWSVKNSRWDFVAAGILNDYSTTEVETVFNGLDYKSVMNQIYSPIVNMTFATISPLSTALGVTGYTDAPDVPFRINSATATTALRYINTTALSISTISVTAYGGNNVEGPSYQAGYYINGDAATSYWQTPAMKVSAKAIWNSATTTGFANGTSLSVRVYASPPSNKDGGEPPLSNSGLVGDFEVPGFGAMSNGFTWNIDFTLFTEEVKKAIIAAGQTFEGQDPLQAYDIESSNPATPLRTGVTYALQIYAAVYRTTGNGIWYRTQVGKSTGGTEDVALAEVTLGQQKKDISQLVTEIFNNAKSATTQSRIKYANLSISGSTYTQHTTFSPGKPSLTYIADICDLEMGARGDGTKAIFNIVKPINGGTYSGDFKLSLQVSSAALTTGPALRYPDNVKSYSFSPGYSRVANDITVIPSDRYLTGSSGQNSGGTNIVGGTAIDTATLSTWGTIPLVVSKAGFVNAQGAQNEANRLLRNKKIENSKQVGLRVVTDGLDLWDGWDVGDSITVTIKHGLTDVSEPFVISGARWFGESNGVERLELDLVQGTYFASSFANVLTSSAGGDAGTSSYNMPTRQFAPRANS